MEVPSPMLSADLRNCMYIFTYTTSHTRIYIYTNTHTHITVNYTRFLGELPTSSPITSSPAMPVLHMNSHPIWGALLRASSPLKQAPPSNSKLAQCILFPLLSSTVTSFLAVKLRRYATTPPHPLMLTSFPHRKLQPSQSAGFRNNYIMRLQLEILIWAPA